MDLETAWRSLLNLPSEAKGEVVALIEALEKQTAPGDRSKKTHSKDLVKEPFIGMWRDCEDMRDSSAWVRACREREWKIPRV